MDENAATRERPPVPPKAARQRAAEDGVRAEWHVGDVILDTYEVTGILGEGGMGKVYKVHHRGWNVDLAVKSPRAEILTKVGSVENFVRECEAWVNLGLHPHVVSCYYVRTLGGIPRVFAEYVAGGSLMDWIEREELYAGGPEKALARMLDVAIQMAWGLQHAHECGLVHQDVKPANVMLAADGTAKVTDFGLAKARGMAGGGPAPGGQSILVSVGGMTPAYCSPEQAVGQALSHKTDIWSWGVSILEMFSGEVSWLGGQAAGEALIGYLEDGPRDSAIPPMPAGLAALLKSCFQRSPDDRPPHMAEIAGRLQQVYRQATEHVYVRPEPRAAALQGDSLNNKALSLYDLGRVAEAEALWQANLQANPGHLETTYNLGLVQWRDGHKDDAVLVRDLQGAAVSGDHWRRTLLLSQIHLERGEVEHALTVLEALSSQAAASPEVAIVRRHAGELEGSGHRLHRTFAGHTAPVTAACLSGDGRYALSRDDDQTVKIWEVRTGKCLHSMAGQAVSWQAVHLSGDGRYVLSGTTTIGLWDMATGACVRTLDGHKRGTHSVCLSDDGRHALSASDDRTLKLWDVATGQCIRTFEGHTRHVASVCLSRDGHCALSGSWDMTLKLWDMATGRCLRTFEGHAGFVHSVCLSEDGFLAISGSGDETVKLWDVVTGQCLRTFEGHVGEVRSTSLGADGRYALSKGDDRTIKVWDLATGKCQRTCVELPHPILDVCPGGDGFYALSADYHTLKLWAVPTVQTYDAPFAVSRLVTSEMAVAVEALRAEAQAARQNEDVAAEARMLRRARSVPGHEHDIEIRAAWSRLYGKLRRVALRDAWLVRTLAGHAGGVASVCLSADERYVLSGSEDWSLKLWELATGKCLRTFDTHTLKVSAVYLSSGGYYALSGSGESTVSGSANHTLKLWEVGTGRCLRTFAGHTAPVSCIGVSGDGRYALSGSYDGTLKLWEVATGRCLRTFAGHADIVRSVCLSGDGRYVLSGSWDKTQKLWDVVTGQCLRTFTGHTSFIESVCLSDDGRYALSGGKDKTLKLWQVATGECLRTFQGHQGSVQAVCLSGDGLYALSASEDQTLKLWDVATGQCVRTLEGHTRRVNSVCMSRDGRYALSGGDDKTLKLWELDWELEDTPPADWDEGARPYLQNYLTLHTPYAGELSQGRAPSQQEITLALTRRGQPRWNEEEFQQLLLTLGCAGYGWLRPEGVRRELERMAGAWKGAPPSRGA